MKYWLLFFTMFSTAAYGESLSLALPSAPQSYQSDSFRSGELDCSNAIGSATNLEFGVTGVLSEEDPFNNNYNSGGDRVGVYARIVIPLGGRARSRINCDDLYQLELQRKRLEVMRLEEELRQLRALQFED